MIEVPVGPLMVKMDPAGGGCGVCQHMLKEGCFEPESLAVWAAALRPGRVALDIGAYTGIYAIGAALMGATVWAFEPYPVTFDRLHHNAGLNGIGTTGREGLTSVMNAVSAEAGDALLCHDRPRGFPSAASLERSGRYGVQVTTVALDQLTLPGRVSVMKIDVERHEPAVLRGAAALLERDRPVLIVESLGPAEERAILAAAPDYRIMNRLDRRNLLLERS